MAVSTRPITYDDSLTMPEGRFEEIVNGELRRMPPPTLRHGILLKKFSAIVEPQLDAVKFVVLSSEFGLGIRRDPVLTYRIPDRMIFVTLVFGYEDSKPDDRYIWQTPELIVECLSPANRKGPVLELLADYESIRVPEVWLLDPHKPLFTRYLPVDNTLVSSETLREGVVSSKGLPNLRVDLSELWAAYSQGAPGLSPKRQ